jgi:2-oxoacid:acceptor oxidoreductase gamma subunit (pyruvate/2-ketoisovalerate family)
MGSLSAQSTPGADASAGARTMHEIRLAGRGGQGVVTAGDLLGKAAVLEGRHAQSIPTFGPERRGALSSCTLRISEEPILLKCSSTRPHVLLVLDPTIWHHFNVLLGLQAGGTMIFNTAATPDQVQAELTGGAHGYVPPIDDYTLYTVDATDIALEVLKRPITNTSMMGALSGATGLVGMEWIEQVLTERFGKNGPANVEAARAARERLLRLGD